MPQSVFSRPQVGCWMLLHSLLLKCVFFLPYVFLFPCLTFMHHAMASLWLCMPASAVCKYSSAKYEKFCSVLFLVGALKCPEILIVLSKLNAPCQDNMENVWPKLKTLWVWNDDIVFSREALTTLNLILRNWYYSNYPTARLNIICCGAIIGSLSLK